MQTEYSQYERFRGVQMAVTTHSQIKSEWRGPQVVLRSLGEVLMENKVARAYLRRADLEREVSVKVALRAGT